MKRVYSVLIAEDESEIRRALAAMVEEHPSFRVAGCAGDGKAALRMIEALRPDVLMTSAGCPRHPDQDSHHQRLQQLFLCADCHEVRCI